LTSATHSGARAALTLAAYAIAASLVTPAIRYLSFHFDHFTQNAYRFLTGAACLLLLSVLLWPGELRRLLRSRRGMAGVVTIAGGGAVAQSLVVEGVGRTSAVLGALIPLLAVPLMVVLGALIFADERTVVRGRGFLVGAPLALVGAVGLALARRSPEALAYTQGVYLLLAGTVLGTGLTLLSKRMVMSFHPVCITTLNTTLMCPLFFLGAYLWGNPGEALAQASPQTLAILFGSGAYGMLVGGGFYYICLQRYGAVRTTFTNLAAPVFTGAVGYLLFREGMSPAEIVSAALLLAGAYLVIAGKGRERGERAPHARPLHPLQRRDAQ
jgi:drug/metabolite transporter (DMT)-like permease